MKVVNVASIPQLSPFRYPGGKTWLIPHIRQWLRSRQPKPAELIDLFAGGAIVGLTAAAENLALSVTLIEKDPDVAAVWNAIFNGRQGRWLADRIVEFEFSPETVRGVLETANWKLSLRERAFKTLLRNRVQRGGILAPGAGVMKEGENGRGMASRWYPDTLRKRILALLTIKHRITFEESDGIALLRANLKRSDVVFFIDPPYTVAGRRLYSYSTVDHEELFALASQTAGDFLMTYDNAEEIRKLADWHGFDTRLIAMKNTHHAQMTELLIGRNLAWLPSQETPAESGDLFSLQIA